jgi:hypothetical protein
MPPEPTSSPPKKRQRPPSTVVHITGPDGKILCGKGGSGTPATAPPEEMAADPSRKYCRSCLQSHALGEKRQPKAPKPKGEMRWIPGLWLEEFDAWLAERMGAIEGDRK